MLHADFVILIQSNTGLQMHQQLIISTIFICHLFSGVSLFAQQDCMQTAREFHRNSDYVNAIEVLLNCSPDAKSNEYAELLSSAYYHTGDLKSAYREVQKIPDSISGTNLISLKARITFARGDFESAYRYYVYLSTSDSLNSHYMRQLGACADKLDSIVLAISYYRKALDLNPDDMQSGMKLVEKLVRTENLAAADSLSLMLLAVDSLPDLLRLRGDILYRQKNYDAAWLCYEPLLRKGTSDADLLRKAGVCKFATGDTEMAITLLSTSHVIYPNDEITCYYLGMAYQSKPDFKSSELYFKSAITNGISQNISNYYQRMGDMYETSGNYVKALEAYQSALKYREENDKLRPELNYQVGRMYEVYFDDYRSAILYYENFLRTYADTTDFKYIGIKIRKENLEKLVK